MLDLATELGDDNFNAFMRALVRGEYHTLLGAGASAGGIGGDGDHLPIGAGLCRDLCEEFEISGAGASLKRVFAAAQRRTSRGGESVSAYFSRRFTQTVPPSWMSSFIQLPWAQIWTLNVDDCLERAYGSDDVGARQTPLSVSWTEKHRTPKHGLDEVLIVHLHGKASRASRPNELVFDISAYLHAAQANYRWHSLFGDYYPTKPFLVIGASLDEEIDLQAILEQGRTRETGTPPSILTNKDIDALQAEEYREFGLLPVRATAEMFFAAVDKAIQPFIDELTHSESATLSDISPHALTFLSQWQAVREDKPGPDDRRHDLFAGHQPEWIDVLANKVVHRGIERRLVDMLSAEPRPGRANTILVRGGIFSGKTATLLSTARELIRAGYQPYLHNGDVAPDAEAVVWWVKRYPKTVLLIDDAFDFTFDVADIVSLSDSARTAPRILMTERASRARGTDRNLEHVDVQGLNLSDTLTSSEIRGFISTLSANHRLGVMTGLNNADKVSYFDKHHRQLFSALADLERGRGFEARVKDEYAAITDPTNRLLMGMSGLASSLGYGIPTSVLPRTTGLRIQEIERRVAEGDLADYLQIRRNRLQPRHRIFGTMLVDNCLTAMERFELSMQLSMAVAPHVSPAAIGIRSIYYLIARALMTHKVLEGLFDHDYNEVLRWYEAAEPAYGWNARFWEQRALAASVAGMFEPAYSWAKQAVHVRTDAFTLNTVGTVLMRRALSEATAHNWPTDSFEAAESALREARGLEADESEYPYETFFSYTCRLAETVVYRDAALTAQLRYLWDQWYIQCLTLDAPSQARLRPTLTAMQPRWQAITEKQDHEA